MVDFLDDAQGLLECGDESPLVLVHVVDGLQGNLDADLLGDRTEVVQGAHDLSVGLLLAQVAAWAADGQDREGAEVGGLADLADICVARMPVIRFVGLVEEADETCDAVHQARFRQRLLAVLIAILVKRVVPDADAAISGGLDLPDGIAELELDPDLVHRKYSVHCSTSIAVVPPW